MICRRCKGTGKIDSPKAVRSKFVPLYTPAEKIMNPFKKMCPDCFGSGKVINKERGK